MYAAGWIKFAAVCVHPEKLAVTVLYCVIVQYTSTAHVYAWHMAWRNSLDLVLHRPRRSTKWPGPSCRTEREVWVVHCTVL